VWSSHPQSRDRPGGCARRGPAAPSSQQSCATRTLSRAGLPLDRSRELATATAPRGGRTARSAFRVLPRASRRDAARLA
jgi:hypothetical protein